MRKLAILLLLALVFPLCSAAVYINEIVPDPTDDCKDCTEWIELYNSGDEAVDVANWTLTDKKDRYMYIKAEYTEGGSTEISADGYIVIYPGKEGEDLYRNIYLTNSEDTIRLFDGDIKIDETTYSFSKNYDVAWARVPDASDNWIKTESTRGDSNGEEPEEEDEPKEDEETDDDSDDEEDSTDTDDEEEEEQASVPKEEEPEKEDSNKVTGKVVFVSDQKKSLTKPLLLLLLGLLVVVVAMQVQLMRNR